MSLVKELNQQLQKQRIQPRKSVQGLKEQLRRQKTRLLKRWIRMAMEV